MKTFLILSINFFLLNREVERSQLRVIDKKIRGMINKELKIKRLSIEYDYASWKDGGLSDPSLRDRGDVLRIRSFAHMTLSDDMGVWAAMRQFTEDEREFRRIETDVNAQFLDWKERKGASTGTSIIIEKTRRACKNQDVRLKLEGAFMVIKANVSEKKTNSAVGIGRYLTQKVMRPRKIEILLKKEKHGTTFTILEDNLISNEMLTDAKTTKSDLFFRFTVAARADILLISANIQQ
jgi:shikimate kinase